MLKLELSPQDFDRLGRIVNEETGNKVTESNFSMLESRLRSRCAKLGIDLKNYWKHFEAHDDDERAALKSLMTTHYTFFFREYVHFEILEQWIEENITELRKSFQKEGRKFRLWSAACSKGQEVYSLAMFLHENLLEKHGIDFEIIGSDIDPEAVAYATNGVYPLKEVNTIPRKYLAQFWKKGKNKLADFAAIKPSLKEKVHFQTNNLLDIKIPKDDGFDVIFCRNVLIYFTEENVRKIALGLSSRMKKDSLFISGVSEPIRFPEWRLKSYGPSSYAQGGKAQDFCVTTTTPSTSSPRPAEIKRVSPSIPLPSVPAAQKYSVLCVDDSPTIQNLMKKIFSRDNNCKEVVTALNGREAYEQLQKRSFDLITLDIHMPEVTGIEFMERFYDRRNHPPVIMVSSVSRTDVDLASKSLNLGAFDYVEKPAMNRLKESMEEILTKTQLALRSRVDDKALPPEDGELVSRKIVVPDASSCLRAMFHTGEDTRHLSAFLRAAAAETRSPPFLVIRDDTVPANKIEKDLVSLTQQGIEHAHDAKQFLRPNKVYHCSLETWHEIAALQQNKQVSLFCCNGQYEWLKSVPHTVAKIQVLLDESLAEKQRELESRAGVRVSDITPSTSFQSLSVEFFAAIRKAAA